MLRLSEDNMNQKEVKTQGGSIVIIQIVAFLDSYLHFRSIQHGAGNETDEQRAENSDRLLN